MAFFLKVFREFLNYLEEIAPKIEQFASIVK